MMMMKEIERRIWIIICIGNKMTSLFGTIQAYQPLASTYLALAPECGDKIFGSDINYCNLVKWGIYDGQEYDPKVLQAYKQQQKQSKDSILFFGSEAMDTYAPTSYSTSPSNQSTTVMSVLNQLPNVKTMQRVLRESGWENYLNQANDLAKVTLFVPTDEAFFNSTYMFVPNDKWSPNNLRALGQAHTLPFAFDQSAANDRKLRLYTSLPSYSLYLDGTGEVSKQLNFYIPPDVMLNLRYPQPLRRINILQGFYTNNGALYIIDGVFDPNVLSS